MAADDDIGSSSEEVYTFFKDRPEWKDVTPVPQDDGPYPVVRIAYSERFQDVFDYFRAVLKSNEISERAFELTTEAADLNPANYTIWHYRRELLKGLNKDLMKELEFISGVIEEHPKNYQVWLSLEIVLLISKLYMAIKTNRDIQAYLKPTSKWHHRRVIVELSSEPSLELEFTSRILKKDTKNYHAWSHRQWVIQTYNLWEGELDYVTMLLNEDLRNNSAWNQRFFVISNHTEFDDATVNHEVSYTKDIILKAPNNESSWSYLKGIISNKAKLYNYPGLEEFCKSMYDKELRSPYLLAFMIDMCEDQLESGVKDEKTLTKATELCTMLADKIDPIRKKYWDYFRRRLISRYGS